MGWLDNCDVVAIEGDLATTEADAIACGLKTTLDPYGAVMGAVLKSGGKALAERLAQERARLGSPLLLGQATSLRDIELSDRHLHLILVAYWGRTSDYTPALVSKAYTCILRQAFKLEVKHLAVPLLGGKPWASRFPLFCQTVVKVLRDFDQLKGAEAFSVEELTFVSGRTDQVDSLNEHLGGL